MRYILLLSGQVFCYILILSLLYKGEITIQTGGIGLIIITIINLIGIVLSLILKNKQHFDLMFEIFNQQEKMLSELKSSDNPNTIRNKNEHESLAKGHEKLESDHIKILENQGYLKEQNNNTKTDIAIIKERTQPNLNFSDLEKQKLYNALQVIDEYKKILIETKINYSNLKNEVENLKSENEFLKRKIKEIEDDYEQDYDNSPSLKM